MHTERYFYDQNEVRFILGCYHDVICDLLKQPNTQKRTNTLMKAGFLTLTLYLCFQIPRFFSLYIFEAFKEHLS